MAPEVLRVARGNLDGHGHHVDRWGLSISLCFMWSGIPPSDQVADAGDQSIGGAYDFDGPEWADVSEEGRGVVRALLCAAPGSRRSLSEAARALWHRGARAGPQRLGHGDLVSVTF